MLCRTLAHTKESVSFTISTVNLTVKLDTWLKCCNTTMINSSLEFKIQSVIFGRSQDTLEVWNKNFDSQISKKSICKCKIIKVKELFLTWHNLSPERLGKYNLLTHVLAVCRNGHFVPSLALSTNSICGATPKPRGGSSSVPVTNCRMCP